MVRSRQYDHRIDLWCIGVLAYELCTGKAPFEGNGQHDTQDNIIFNPVPFRSFHSQAFMDFVQNLLKKEASRRMSIEMLLNHPWIKHQELVAPTKFLKL